MIHFGLTVLLRFCFWYVGRDELPQHTTTQWPEECIVAKSHCWCVFASHNNLWVPLSEGNIWITNMLWTVHNSHAGANVYREHMNSHWSNTNRCAILWGYLWVGGNVAILVFAGTYTTNIGSHYFLYSTLFESESLHAVFSAVVSGKCRPWDKINPPERCFLWVLFGFLW